MTTEDVWKILPKSSLPTSAHIIRLIWSFNRKNSFGELTKHKASLFVHGGMQREGNKFHNTFAPIVNYYTVRLIIMMSQMAGWELRQIDYVLDFSPAECYANADFSEERCREDAYQVVSVFK